MGLSKNWDRLNKIGKAVCDLGQMVDLTVSDQVTDEEFARINKHNALLKEIYDNLSLLQQLDLIANEPQIEFSVSHSQLYGHIYVYDAHDSIAFTLEEQEFNEITGRDANKLDDDEIKIQVYTHYKQELQDLCSD